MTPRPSLQWTQAHCSVPRLPEATFYPTWATRPPTSRVPSDVCAKSVQAMTYRVLRSSLYSSSEARCQHCQHAVCELWKWDRCLDCGADLGESFLEAQRAKAEAAEAEDLAASGGDPSKHAEHTLLPCGVRLDWLLAFTFDHDCWQWTTARVVRDIVQPATQARRCRYAHLPEVQSSGATGPARVFMSHCWNGLWGDLVLAACSVSLMLLVTVAEPF